MRGRQVRITSALIASALLSLSVESRAQDTQFLPPDVLLLIDTSGSMALTTFRENGQFVPPKCGTWVSPKMVNMNATTLEGIDTTSGKPYTAPDRWAMLVKTLTGTPLNMACVTQQRTDPLFIQEHSLGTQWNTGLAPVDAKYYLPYNRIVAVPSAGTACTPAPSWNTIVRNQLVNDALSWPASDTYSPIYWRQVGDFTGSNAKCTFVEQDEDGLIDAYRETVRFGLMTFDTGPYWNDNGTKRVGIGFSPGSHNALYAGGIQDTWSYFENWLTDTANVPQYAGTGLPGGCSVNGGVPFLWETGARNPAAPPWEGRMISFGNPTASTAEIVAQNKRVEQALLTARPYGQTPIAAMLHDARYFLLTDNTGDNNNTTFAPFIGGKVDPAFTTTKNKGCRKRKVILFTDGAPNWDLRPDCEITGSTPPGKCPAPKAQDIAEDLYNHNIPVYVIGLSVSNGGQTCKQIFDANANACSGLTTCDSSCPSSKCAYGYCINSTTQESLAQCCVIRAIADKGSGSTNHGYYPENQSELVAAFGIVLSESYSQNASKTQEAASTLSQSSSSVPKNPQELELAGGRFYSSYRPDSFDLFSGTIERQRYNCKAGGTTAAEPQDVTPSKGDAFQARVDANRASRKIYTVVGATVNNKINSDYSIRPWYKPSAGQGDLLGTYGVTSASDSGSKMITGTAQNIKGSIDPLALLGANGSPCFATPVQLNPTPTQCRDRILQEEFGLPVTGNSDIKFVRKSALGAIMRSTPIIVEAPNEIVRDQSYNTFRGAFARRTSVLYAASIDGQLHAFNMWDTTSSSNELWSFIPPAALSRLGSQFKERYNGTTQYLLDGPITVRNVPGVALDPNTGKFLTRQVADATTPGNTRWYTILLGSFGRYGGYYALDVTWPNPDSTDNPPTGYHKGPRFLWQLTTDENGQPLFGDRSGVPSIATLYFKMPGTSEAPAEHVVAILPGGMGGAPAVPAASVDVPASAITSTTVTPKTKSRKYVPVGTSPADSRSLGGARSVTIVRLDTGEVVSTLRLGPVPGVPDSTDLQAPEGLYSSQRVVNAPLYAPVTGQLISYPTGAGSIADRAYVGDAEGHLVRLDLSNPDPKHWSAKIFFDAYPSGGINYNYTWQDGAPIVNPPIISVTALGEVTVAFSTGEQDNILPDGKYYNVWSLTEGVNGTSFNAKVNWYLNHNTPIDSGAYNLDPPSASECGGTASGVPLNRDRFEPGERVSGPLTLFASNLYFTTYDPTVVDKNACTAAYSYVWGVHYIKAVSDPNSGPAPALEVPSVGTVRYKPLCSGSIAYGAPVAQAPSCVKWEQSSQDTFLGYGSSHYSLSSMAPGAFQLVIQAGKMGVTGASTKVTNIDLKPPLGGTVIDSWSSILE